MFDEKYLNRIICGDCLEVLPTIRERSVNLIVTSPPYWGLHDYKLPPLVWGGNGQCRHKWEVHILPAKGGVPVKKAGTGRDEHMKIDKETYLKKPIKSQFCSLCGAWKGSLGLEPTPELYIEHLMMVFDQCKRVLRDDGLMFVNINDTYGTGSGAGSRKTYKQETNQGSSNWYEKTGKPGLPGFEKSLCAIPERFVLAMMERGWIRRCTIIWAKGFSYCNNLCPQCGLEVQYSGSCMPDSAKDRPNKNGFEYIYMFSKTKRYWYEQQYEEAQELNAERPRMGQGNQTIYKQKRWKEHNAGVRDWQGGMNIRGKDAVMKYNPLGRTVRNVLAINPKPTSEPHFATYPPKLVEICVKMGCPEFVCKKCGLPRVKEYNTDYEKAGDKGKEKYAENTPELTHPGPQGFKYGRANKITTQIGYTDCGCGVGFRPGIVLDPFNGIGTTTTTAYKMGRDFIGIDLSEKYCKVARRDLERVRDVLFEAAN